jgi:hypothetical protein
MLLVLKSVSKLDGCIDGASLDFSALVLIYTSFFLPRSIFILQPVSILLRCRNIICSKLRSIIVNRCYVLTLLRRYILTTSDNYIPALLLVCMLLQTKPNQYKSINFQYAEVMSYCKII